MLGRFELLSLLGGTLIIMILVNRIAKYLRGNILPPGSVMVGNPLPESGDPAPVTRGSLVGLLFAIGSGLCFSIFTLIACIFDFWYLIPTFFFIRLPVWLNWAGIASGWAIDAWNLAAMYYNVNFTLAFKRLKGTYVLATGGPYKWVRHPVYAAGCVFAISIFLVTEFWLLLLGILFWGTVRAQAIEEENLMRKTFGAVYEHYYHTTGRFFPKYHWTIRTGTVSA
ncbi:MAG: isoprenylcysteine carboxyl methyltransferase [Promethearchaeota archaeon CR_4]|nr:MAG: isoprenylcysteine carboxyl methyltransferase [Candidatus Lokiarchaeota archaeon CR_4]